ncbi:3-hydroxyisobutyrate dehydrogenase-like beta-hydroxyacid dehydrogenase [Novosphingobium chloroacetimidivorans]|uniref:3-hydroxyisobutyrate dehydrogenase-like beta-hydroxyacid dehydrogenase n=1 Tax=Novosphingobium chloroacetimidivorans TaxID=1428314 RepID=A0A7W7K9M1_9SPHN|nr:NAD(P)-dependent oxidoreductase [Novosphingobium chloroacetimidivorans]MBB4858764.1 3-hydroxyisobutyrate dehydrogenase-like beta-hydroxyacid dehydrogenase [Novosphingobium chloroacetimidivorans]
MEDISHPISCGFIGLGSQGAPIARRMIDAGFPTMLWARREAAFEPYRNTTALFVTSLEEVGAHSDHVGICVVNDDDVREVCATLIPSMRPGARLAIHSTIHPQTCREMETLGAKHGVEVIDAPVSGGSPAAEAGTLTLMLGGEPAAIAKSMPVFETFGRLIVRLGDVGAGQHVKLLNNSLLLANLGLVEAVLNGGDKLGVDRSALLNLLLNSSGKSFALEVRSRMADPGSFRHGGALLRKDLRLLGEVLGESDEAAKILRDASKPFVSVSDRIDGAAPRDEHASE